MWNMKEEETYIDNKMNEVRWNNKDNLAYWCAIAKLNE